MANITQSDQLSKLLCADIYLDHNEGANPLTTLQPVARVVGTAHKGPGDSYHYELSYVQARGLGFGRNVLNELREPLMAHIRGLFEDTSDTASSYLTSEDYQYDRGEELRERAADPTIL